MDYWEGHLWHNRCLNMQVSPDFKDSFPWWTATLYLTPAQARHHFLHSAHLALSTTSSRAKNPRAPAWEQLLPFPPDSPDKISSHSDLRFWHTSTCHHGRWFILWLCRDTQGIRHWSQRSLHTQALPTTSGWAFLCVWKDKKKGGKKGLSQGLLRLHCFILIILRRHEYVRDRG